LKRAVFLDRDGVVNRRDLGYVNSPDDLELLPGVPQALKSLADMGFLLILVTNQAGVGEMFMDEHDLEAIHGRLEQILAAENATLNNIYCCTHARDAGCNCRKPKIGLLEAAASQYAINLRTSYMVGDSPSDMECGVRAACTTIFILGDREAAALTGQDEKNRAMVWSDFLAWDLADAAKLISELEAARG